MIPRDALLATVAAMLEATAHAHHEAYLATDGEDAEWPLWYAEHVHNALADVLDREFTQAELVWALVDAERARQSDGDDATPWPKQYAGHIMEWL